MAQAENDMAMSTHRAIQVADLMDRASTNRVRYYINARRASSLGNRGAACHFTNRAARWEAIRASCAARFGRNAT
jgi:hypothetical protein